MAAEADIPEFPDPIPPLKIEAEDKEMTSELPNIIVSEGPKEERKKIESWLSQPPEIIGFFRKAEAEEVGNTDEVANMNVINKGSVEKIESDVFSDSLSVADEKPVSYTEHSQMTSGGEKSDTLADSETMSMSSKEASQEKVELAEEMKDSNSVGNELPHKSQESSFFKTIKEVFFHKVDNLETSSKESESGMKDFAKESHHEAGHGNELLENIAAADSDQSTTGMHDEIQDAKADILFGQQRESTADNIVAEEQSGQCHIQKTEQEAPMDFEEIETEGSGKYAETVKNVEEQKPVGSPEEIVGEKLKDKSVDVGDVNTTEVQEANNLPTVDLDEKTRSAELEIPNKSGSESWITHPLVKEEVRVESENQDEVSMFESGDPPEAIQLPNKEEKQVNEASEATERPKSTVSEPTATEGELNVEETSTSEIDSNMEKGCELKSDEALKDINTEDNVEESEQTENAFNAEFFVERKGDDNGKSTIEEDLPVNKGGPLCLEGEEHHHDEEEKVRSIPFDGGDHSYMTQDEINSTDEQIIYQEVCEDSKTADRAEDREKVMHNEENTVNDFSPEPMGECTTKFSEGNEMDTKKHKAEASEGYDTSGESMILEESAITDIPSPDVREEKVEESLKEDRRDTTTSDKEVSESIECRERDSEATHSKEESTVKDLKDEAEANEGLTAQSIMGSSEEETAQESNSNVVQSSSVPDVIEKEVKTELLEKEDSKEAVETEETRLTEAESEYPMRVDSSNLIPEDKDQVKTETSKMRSNDMDIIAESAEISNLGDNGDMNIPTERKDGAVEAAEKTQPESKTETCGELSTEDQREISTIEESSKCMPEQEHLESSTMPLVAHNLVTGVTEPTGEVLEKERALSDKEETPIAAETTGEYIAETEGDSTVQENDTNMGSIDIGRESPIDDALVQELHAPLELDYGKSIPESESDVELLKGVDTSEAANASNMSEQETSNDEKSSHIGVEPDKSEYEEAVHEASQGVEVGGGCIGTENNIIEQENPAKNNEGISKEGVEIEKATGEFESEADGCGSFASETQRISTQTEKKIEMEDRELATELPNVTVNEVTRQEKENTESWLSQPPESIGIPEAESVQVAHDDEVGNVDAVDNVGTTEGESFPKSTLAVDGELNEYSEDDRLNNKEAMSSFQEEEGKAKMVTDKYGMAEASDGQDEGVRIQTPELIGGSSRDVEMLNEVPHEEITESIMSTETTSGEQDLKETSFDREDEKSNTLEMDAEATQPSTDIGVGKNKGEEMPGHGVKDDFISTETATGSVIDEPTESNVGATDKLGSLLVTEPDVCKNLDDSSMACKDEVQETSKLVERAKEDASIEDEAEKHNLESSFVERAENVETSREESKTGMEDIDKEMQKEAENQDETLENATTADIDPRTEGEDVENKERKSYVAAMKSDDSMTRESEDIAPAEAMSVECESRVMVAPGEDRVVAEEQEATETSKHEEHSEQILNQNAEPAKANLGRPSVIASEVFERTLPNDYIESITKVEEEEPVGSQEEILEEKIIAAESNEDGTTEAKNISMNDAGEKTRSEEFNITNNDVNEVYVTPRPVEEPEEDENSRTEVSTLESEEQDKNESETAKENLGSPLIVALEELTTSHDGNAESITNIEEERPVGNPEEIVGEQRSDKIMIADDSNKEEIPDAESLPAVDSDEKARSEEIKIPDNNTREVCVTHPPVEETVMEGDGKQNEVSFSESVDPVHEASASEFPGDEEKDANDSYEASKSSDCNISEPRCYEGEVNTVVATSAKEIPGRSEEEILWQPRNDENMISQIPEAENPSTVDSYVTPTSMEETFLEGGENKNDASMSESRNQVCEASEFPGEEEKESDDRYEATKSPGSNILEDASTEGALNMEPTSTRSDVDTILDKGCEVISADELKELKAEDNLGEDIKQKEQDVDSEFQMPTKSGDKEKSTIKGESLVKNNDPTSTGEGKYHRDQEDEVMSNRSKETLPALDSGEHSCTTSNEINIIDEEIQNEETIQAHEDPQIADSGEDTEDLMKDAVHAVADHSTELTGDHATKCSQENETEVNMHGAEVLQILPTAEVSANIGMQMKEEDCTTKDNFAECYGEEAQKKCTYDEEKKEREPDTVASNIHGSAPLSTTTAECPISDPPSSFTGEEKVEERLKEDRGDEEISEMELSSSHVECIEAVHSTEEREGMASKQEAEATEEFNGQSITEPSLVETTQKERNVDFGENSTSMPEICEREIKEVLGTEDSSVPMVAEESRLTLAEGDLENISGLESADLVFQEKALVPTETSKMGLNAARTGENSISGEDNNVEIPTAREAATVESFETSMDNISEPTLRAPSAPTLEEQNIMSPEVGETTGEAPEKEKKTEKEETSLAEETTEDEREKGYEPTNPIEGTNLGSIDEQKKRENDYAAVKDREFYIPSEQNIESKTESDVELLRRVNTSEVANPNEISKSETVEELKSSETDKSEYDTAITETSEGVESWDTEKSILQEDDSAKKLEGSAEESDEIEKAPVQFEAEMQGSEASKAKSISTPKEENINIVEHDETAVEFPEMNPTNTEEQRHDDENQTITSTDEKVNGQDIQEGKLEMSEEMETKLENQEETNGTQDAILTEKVSTGIEQTSEREKNMEEESCTRELHILPAEDGTFNEVPTVISSSSESEIIKEQIMEEDSCTKELHQITAADDTKNDGRETDLTPQSHEATSSDKNAEMMGSNIAEDLHMESEATQKEVNEPQDAFSTEEVSTETSSAMDEVAYPDLTAIHSVEATSSNKITELMESKTAQDLKESEASPMAEVLEDETKKNEKHVDVSSLVSEGSEEKIKGEKIEDTEKFDDETDITQVVVTDLSSLGQVQLNEEPVKSLDTSSDAESQQTSKKDDVGEQELEETSFIESQLPIHEYENANNAHIHVEKSDAKDLEDEATTITDSVCLSDDQAVKEVHETGSSLNVIEHDTKEIQKQTREVTQVSLEPTDAARDDEIIPGQIPQPEETGEQLQVPSSGLLSDEQESDATTGIGMGSTTKDAVEEAKMRQSEVRIIGAELETTSEGESIENQVQGEENRVQNMSTVSSAEEMDAESSKDNSIITKMSAEEVNQTEKNEVKDRKVLESKHGGQDTDEPLKALVISSDTGSLQTTDISDARQQELDETSSVVSQFPVDEHEKSENIRANVDKSDTYDVEEKEIEIPGAVPKPTDQEIQDIQETGTSLPVGEVHTTEIAHQAREVPEVFSKDIKQGVEAVSGNEIIAPVATREVTSLEELQLKQHVEALDTHSIAENPDAIKTVGVSQQDAEFENMNLEENCSMVSHPPIYVHEEEDRENVAPEKSQADYIEVEETVPKSEDQADKEIHEIGTSLNVGDSGTNEIEKPISEVPEALSYAMNQGVDIARNDEITSSQILQDEKLEDQLEAPSTGLLSEEQENETTTTDKKGIADGDDIEGTKILEAEIREELETTSVGKGTGNQVQAEEKRAQDWSTVSSAEELDTKSSIENAMITKMSTEEIGDELENTSEGKSIENQDQGEENRVQNMSTVSSAEEMDAESSKDNSIITKMSAEEVLESKHGGQDTDEPRKALVISSDTGSLQTTDISDARQQELDETSSVVSQFPVDEREKSENIRANVDKSDTYDVEEKEIEIPGAVPKPTDQEVQDIQETGTSLPVGEVPTTEITHQAREVPEAFSKAIKQGVEAVSGDEIIAPVATREVTSLEELQLKQHVEALDTYSIAENPDAIKTVGVSQQDAEFENMNLEETCSMVSHPPIYVHEEEDRENVAPEKSQANYVEVEDTEIPETVLKSQDQADKEIHEIGKSLNVGDSGTNEIEKPISEVPEALSYAMNQGIDIARNDEITSSQILQDEKLEDQLEAPSSGLLSEEQENETTTTDKKGIADGDDIEGTKILEAEIREELETTSAGKGIGNQVQAEEKRAQDWSKVTSAEELDTKSSIENAMITKMSTEEVLEPDHGGHDTDEHLKALDTSSDTERLQTTQTPDASQQELEETSSMVSQLPVHTYEKADNESVTEEKSVGYDADVKEINLPSVVPDSNDQRTTEIEEVGTSVKETRTEEMETQIREVCDALPEDVNQARETVSGDEITSPSEAIEVTSLGEHQIKDEHVDAPDTNKRGDASQQDEEFDNMKHEETSSLESQLPIHEHEKEESANITVEKTDANDVEVEEAEIPDTAPESEELVVKEIQETGTRLATGGADTNAIEKQKRGVPEALSEPINPCFDTSRDYEMTPVKNLQDEKIEEELQVTTSALLSKEEDGETLTAIQKGSTDKDGTQVGSLELQENSGPVFQLPVTEFNSGNNVIEEKSDADIVELNETKAMDAVSDSKDQFFEVAEDTEIDKVDDEIKQVTERIPDLRYIGVDAATGDENLEHDIPLGKLEEQIQLSSSSYESTKEEAAELDKSELEKTTDTSELPTDYGIHHVGTTMKKSESGEVLVEEDKTSKAIPESKGDDFYEFKEIGPSPPVEKIRLDEVQEETKAVPETIFEPTHQGAQTAIHVETAINQTVTTLGAEQLLETESTTQKPCSQDERQRELEVSNLEGSQNISPDEENTGLEKRPTDASSQYEERPIQQSLEEASTDEDIVYSKNSNKDAEEHLTEDIGGKYEEVSNLEFEKNEEVLLESVAAINSAAVPPTSEGIKVIEETPKENKTEVGNGGNHCEETNQEEAIEKYISTEKISEEMQGSRNFDKISLQEEMATEANQEDELRAEDYPGERTSTIFDASRNEIPHERVFKESEEECVDKHMEGMVRADDKGPHQVSASDEIANQSELESHGDETDFTGTATQLKSSEAMLVSQEVERTGGDDEETEISRDGQLQNTDLVVPPVADAAAEETGNGKELETFNDLSEHDLDPNLGNIEPYEHKGEISTAGTINSESLMDNKKLEHKFLEPGCEEGSGTEDFDLTNKDGSNRPSASSTTAASPETLADEGCEKAVDTKHHHFVSDEPTAEPESVPEEGNGFQLEAHTMDKEPVELPVMTDVAKLDENKMRTITATQEEETPQENEKPNVLPPIMDSEMEVSREAVTMNISEDIQGLEETSIVVPHEQTASKRDPSESIEHANIEGMECGDENRMGKPSEEITEESQMTESAKMSLSDLIQSSGKQKPQVVEDVTQGHELMGNKEEPPNETAETIEAEEEEEAAGHDKKDEGEEGDEHKREDSGSDAPVMVEASRDMDVKIAHKKPHHHNILSGVGSKVKHSLAKVKKAITGGKSSHPKPTSPK